tara:strand:+ start:52 stop:756 length:705 start_codon:yes stop_codon:yes gene_type:complete
LSDIPYVLLVEDEESIADALTVGLTREGFDVEWVADGVSAIEAFERKTPNLVLLDVMLPNMSGLDVCRLIRLKSEVPVIMVTAKTEEVDAVVALELGADDYVTKPYQFRELVARVRAILRRVEARNQDKAIKNVPSRLKAGDLVIDQDRHEVLLNDQLIALPLKEYELLLQLVANAGRALSRDDLIDAVWGTDYVGDTKTLDVHIRRIRSRIEDDPQRPLRVITIRGVGYRYEV